MRAHDHVNWTERIICRGRNQGDSNESYRRTSYGMRSFIGPGVADPDANSATMAARFTPVYRITVIARTARAINYQRVANQAELDRAAKQKAQTEAEKAELRAQLLRQFNAILQTRDTARGLIVNMSDVLFDTGKYSLAASSAREARQGGRHRLRASRSEAGCRRSH